MKNKGNKFNKRGNTPKQQKSSMVGFLNFGKTKDKSEYTQPKRYDSLEISQKPTLIISKELQSQILYAHSQSVGKEWSGFLLFREVTGTLKDLDKFVLRAEYVHLLDVGTASYTEFNMDGRVMDMYTEYPKAKECKVGLIHTHHSMDAFFSGTDIQELHDNAGFYPYYLSLIVNHKCEYCAKIAFVGKKSSEKGRVVGNSKIDVEWTLGNNKETDVLVTLDCNIVIEQEEVFCKRVQMLKETYKPVSNVPRASWGSTNDFVSDFRNDLSDWDKPAGSMTRFPDLFGESVKDKPVKDVVKFPDILKTIDIYQDTVSDFLCKVITDDWKKAHVGLSHVLRTLDYENTLPVHRNRLVDEIEDRFQDSFVKFYKKELALVEEGALLQKCIRVLDMNKESKLAAALSDMLSLYLVDAQEEFKEERLNVN